MISILCDNMLYVIYTDKFETCVRAREYGNKKLTEQFYRKENTKPLFEKHGILAAKNFHNYHCYMEVLKILKFQEPTAMHYLYKFSNWDLSKALLNQIQSKNFLSKSTLIWNAIRPKLALSLNDMSVSLSQSKTNLKKALFHNKHQHHETEWLPSHDFNFEMINTLQ